MSGTKLLLDTNVVLYLLSGDETIAELLNGKQIYISFITELELLGYEGLEAEEQEKIKSFLEDCTIINIPEQIKESTIKLRRNYKIKLPDSIIAATSEYLKIPLVTADMGFNKIERINTIIYEY